MTDSKTCADCRFFGRDEEPLPADQSFDKKERFLCKFESWYFNEGECGCAVYVSADRQACPYFEEENADPR